MYTAYSCSRTLYSGSNSYIYTRSIWLQWWHLSLSLFLSDWILNVVARLRRYKVFCTSWSVTQQQFKLIASCNQGRGAFFTFSVDIKCTILYNVPVFNRIRELKTKCTAKKLNFLQFFSIKLRIFFRLVYCPFLVVVTWNHRENLFEAFRFLLFCTHSQRGERIAIETVTKSLANTVLMAITCWSCSVVVCRLPPFSIIGDDQSWWCIVYTV